jgi:hypothetical protein
MNPSRTRNYKGIGYMAIGYFVLGFCQNGSLWAIGGFGTEFVGKVAVKSLGGGKADIT